MIIMINAIREKVRRKDLYVVLIIGILLITFFTSTIGTGSIKVNNTSITEFSMLTPILITFVNLIGGAIAISLSLKTISNEYERKTSHLVWTRNISQIKYHTELSLGNIIASIMATGILYMGIGIFSLINGEMGIFIRIIPAFLITCISISIISLFTSAISIKLPTMITGIISVCFYLLSNLHFLLEIISDMISGFLGKVINVILVLVPNLYEIQSQGSNFLLGKEVDIHVILGGILTLYIISLMLFIFKRKEA